jgi:hypothetical protein
MKQENGISWSTSPFTTYSATYRLMRSWTLVTFILGKTLGCTGTAGIFPVVALTSAWSSSILETLEWAIC